MFDNRREIMQDVFLTYLPAQRFKTSRMTVQLIAPLQRETAAANALLPAVLRRGTVRCPDMESLSAALDTLYGEKLRKFEHEGLLQHKTDRWSLTRRGMDVQNAVLVELMDA